MKERPILFNTEMVNAVVEGRKTQTRRIIKPQPVFKEGTGFHWKGAMYGIGSDYAETVSNFTNYSCPVGRVGDRLWVRETFCMGRIEEDDNPFLWPKPLYVDNYEGQDAYPIYKQMVVKENIVHEDVIWSPSIHMPRSASRIMLEITKIRVERLNDISEKDAIAEGVEPVVVPDNIPVEGGYTRDNREMWKGYKNHARAYRDTAKDSFMSLWQEIYGTQSWDSNEWVWVVEFKRIDCVTSLN